MPDHFTETTTTGYGKRIMNSIGGILFGIALFIGAFVVLFNNEGSVDYSTIAKTAVQIDSTTVSTDPAIKDKLVVTSGIFATDETIGDDMYLNPGPYLAIERDVEMYSWVEKKNEHSTTNTGGSETTTTTYDYVKEWTANHESSASFKYPEGHQNPALQIQGTTKRVSKATIGVYGVDMQSISLPSLSELTLNTENTTLTDGTVLDKSGYIFISNNAGSTYATPVVGDVRISYGALKSGMNATIFGKLNDKTFGTYLTSDNLRFYQAFTGSKEEAIASLHESYVTWIWIWRLVGFLMMWIGLSTVLAPLSVMADFLPMLGGLSRSIIGAIAFVVTLVLSAVTILIAMLFHNVVALVIAVIVVVGGFFLVLNRKKSASSGVKMPPIEPPASTPPSDTLPSGGSTSIK
jgi:hypothetical protein